MTSIAGIAIIYVPPDLAVLVVHAGLLMLMASEAAKHPVILLIRMAIAAGAPGAGVRPGRDREEAGVPGEIGRLPAYREMAFLTASPEPHQAMRGISGMFEITRMAGVTLGFQKRELPLYITNMASPAVELGVRSNERKRRSGMSA